MINQLHEIITDISVLRSGYVVRDGFVFVLGKNPAVYDTLLIRSPEGAVGLPGKAGFSKRTLKEHIELVNRYQLEKARIICDDLSFITQCPSLKQISICPENDFGNGFDYSPIYQLPHLRSVNCRTVYGVKEQYHSSVDYSLIPGLIDISAAGPGHTGYEKVPNLETLWLSNCKKHKNCNDISYSAHLKDVTLMQCSVQSLEGIEKHCALQSISLYHNRSLTDISALASLGAVLRVLEIESCPKITNFTILEKLVNLEHLRLYGSNHLPSLRFLKQMKKLKSFTFTMDVDDGDLGLCMDIPYASCKNRRHFNYQDSQLPKNIQR